MLTIAQDFHHELVSELLRSDLVIPIAFILHVYMYCDNNVKQVMFYQIFIFGVESIRDNSEHLTKDVLPCLYMYCLPICTCIVTTNS